MAYANDLFAGGGRGNLVSSASNCDGVQSRFSRIRHLFTRTNHSGNLSLSSTLSDGETALRLELDERPMMTMCDSA